MIANNLGYTQVTIWYNYNLHINYSHRLTVLETSHIHCKTRQGLVAGRTISKKWTFLPGCQIQSAHPSYWFVLSLPTILSISAVLFWVENFQHILNIIMCNTSYQQLCSRECLVSQISKWSQTKAFILDSWDGIF